MLNVFSANSSHVPSLSPSLLLFLCCFYLAWKTLSSQSILLWFFLETTPNNPCFLQFSTENGYHAGKRPIFLGSKDRCKRLPSKRYKESQQNRLSQNEDRCKRLYSKRYNYSEVPMHHHVQLSWLPKTKQLFPDLISSSRWTEMTLNRSREWWFCRKTCYQYINRDVILSRYSSYLQQEHTFSSIKEHTGNFPRAPIVSPFKKENQAFAQDSRLTLYKTRSRLYISSRIAPAKRSIWPLPVCRTMSPCR